MYGIPTIRRNPSALNLIGSRQMIEHDKSKVHLLLSINLHNILSKIPSFLFRNVVTPSYVVAFRLHVSKGTFSKYRGNTFSINFL